jgi:sugar phosphate isomerase/epimerase
MEQSGPAKNRRSFLKNAVLAAGTAALRVPLALGQGAQPTRFQIACMTLPYSGFSLQRALEGIAAAGFQHVAWGTRHTDESGSRVAVLELDVPPSEAAQLARRSRDLGLNPVMMFAGFSAEEEGSVDAHKKRIEQAAAAGIPQVLTMGSTRGGRYSSWVSNLQAIGPFARAAGVTVVVKQHGGETATGRDTAKIIREVNDEGIRINYDAGNVLDYANVDPIEDMKACLKEIRSFSIKDHRNFPEDQDCGPGFGEIDHYRLLAPVAHTGRAMPLAFENIFAPLIPRPTAPEGIDSLARRAREYVETVVQGLQI